MKISVFAIGFVGVTTAIALSITPVYAAETTSKKAGAMPLLSYKVPLRGAPATRVGGGTRGAAEATFALSVLAPDHTGYTVREKPTIYWYVSKAITTSPVELTVTAPDEIEPLLELICPVFEDRRRRRQSWRIVSHQGPEGALSLQRPSSRSPRRRI